MRRTNERMERMRGRPRTHPRRKSDGERWRQIVASTGMATWEWEVQTGVTRFDERWADIVGYRLAELAPISIQTWLDLVHPDDLARSGDLLARHFAGELDQYDCECRMRHRDGSWVWVHDRGQVVERDAAGAPSLMIGTHTDISERKRTEAQVEQSLLESTELAVRVSEANFALESERANLAAIFEGSQVALVILDERGNVEKLNSAAAELCGGDPVRMVGRSFGEGVGCPSRKGVEACGQAPDCCCCPIALAVQQVLSAGTAVPGFEAELPVERNGRLDQVWMSCTAGTIRIDGQPRVLLSLLDITDRRQMESALRSSEERFRGLFVSSQIGIALVDLTSGRFLETNAAFQRIVGYDEGLISGLAYQDLTPPEFQEQDARFLADLLGGRFEPFDKQFVRSDGSRVDIHVGVSVLSTVEGRQVCWSMFEDVSELKRAEAELLASRDQLQRALDDARRMTERVAKVNAELERERRNLSAIFQSSQAALLIVDHDGVVLEANLAAAELVQVSIDHLLGKRFGEGVRCPKRHPVEGCGKGPQCHLCPVRTSIGKVLQTQTPVRGFEAELPVMREGAVQQVWVTGSASNVYLNGESRVLLALLDATDRKHAQIALQHQAGELKTANQSLEIMANRDALTGLVNRRRFLELVHQAFGQAVAESASCSVLFLDLDNFKYVNDSLGHDAGDQLLRSVAERMSQCVGEESVVARLGGDEFAVLIPAPASAASSEQVARRIVQAMAEPISVGGQNLSTTCSVGVARSADAASVEAVIQNADTAMYYAKRGGKSDWRMFEAFMAEETQDRLDLENDLRAAWDARAFELAFQPLVSLETGRAAEVEVLLRWNHARRGPVSPATFIPLAEEINLIAPLGGWVLEEACRRVVAWRRDVPAAGDLRLAVNVSGKQILRSHFAEEVGEILLRTDMDPENLTLEVTETMIMTDVESNSIKLRALRDLGVRVAIDDFGTGYSSMGALAKLPVDTVKIDRSFVGLLGENLEAIAIMRALVTLCRVLSLDVVAEGVETEDQLMQTQALGCTLAQGYHFARPLAEPELLEWLAQRAARSAEPRPEDGRDRRLRRRPYTRDAA